MAEGGAFSSFTDGSDAYIEQYCTPCGEDNVKEEAVKYCPECDEHLCTRCTRQHTRRNATKSHRLADGKDSNQSVNAVKTKCLYHPDRDIEIYCATHDMVYCSLCIATNHRNCQQVEKIDVNLTRTIDQTEINLIFDEMTNVKESIHDMKTKQRQNLSTLEEQINSLHGHLEDIEDEFIKLIRQLKCQVKKSSDEIYDNLNESSQQVKLTDKQKFIFIKLTKMLILEANVQNRCREPSTINFKEKPELADSIKTVNTLGHASQNTVSIEPRHYKMNSVKEINVQLENEKQTCGIKDICQLPDGRILLADYNNKKIKMLDVHYNIIDSCDLKVSPFSICCVSNNEVAVKTMDGNVQFMSVTSSLSKTSCISVQGGAFLGIAFHNDKLWVSYGLKGINIYNTAGDLIKSVGVKQNGDKIFKDYVSHMAVSDDTVIATDNSDGAVCLKEDGTIIMELRDSRLKKTCGVCVTDNGTVFLCGWQSNNILMFCKDGKCLGELVWKDLAKPVNMCYDRKKNSLLVLSHHSNTIKIFELVH